MQTFSVGEITGYIHELFDADSVLTDVWVQGEVSNLTVARSGPLVFYDQGCRGAAALCDVSRSGAEGRD